MNKQYLMLNLESDTFKGMKADFNELLQQLLEKLFAGRIADGSISMKLSVSLTETYSETMGKDIAVPLYEATVDVKAIPQDCHRPLQVRDPMCNECANRDTSACDHCDGCDKWEPTVK